LGVDIFFIISGFIMYHLTAEKFGTLAYAGEFLKRRLIRVVPLYWIFTSLMILAVVLAPGEVRHGDTTLTRDVASYLFLPALRADGLAVPVLALGWTLNYEMFFYLSYTLALLASRRVGLGALFAVFILIAGFGRLIPEGWTGLRFWVSPFPGGVGLPESARGMVIEFLFGICLAWVFRTRQIRLGPWGLVGGGVAWLILVAVGSHFQGLDRWLWGGIPCLILAGAMVLGPDVGGLVGRAMAKGGDASYALYLSHPFILNLLAVVWIKAHLPSNGWAYIATGMVLCITVAWFTHLWLEVPILGYLRRRFEPRRATLAA